MALNDDAVDDLPANTLVDEDLVKTPAIVTPTDQDTMILVKTSEVPQEISLLTEDDVKKITETNVKFKLIGDQTQKIVDLRAVEHEFIAQESIDRHTAQYLNQHFEGLLSSKLSIEEFTKSPTKTNFDVTKRHVNVMISQEEAAAVIDFSDFTQNALKDTQEVLEKISSDYLGQFQIIMSGIARLSESVIADISQNKNTVVPYQNGEHVEFLDIAEMDMVTLDFGNLKLNTETVSILSKHKQNIEHIIANSSVKTLIVLAVECGKVSYPVDREILVHAMDKPMNLLLLAKFFNSVALRDYIDGFSTTIANAIADIDSTRSETEALAENYSSVKEYLIAKTEMIHCSINAALQIATTINNLNLLALNVSSMFQCLSRIAKP